MIKITLNFKPNESMQFSITKSTPYTDELKQKLSNIQYRFELASNKFACVLGGNVPVIKQEGKAYSVDDIQSVELDTEGTKRTFETKNEKDRQDIKNIFNDLNDVLWERFT